MAKLNPKLILSITKDLNELHDIGIEMLSYVDKCEVVSWRYPNRLIKDIAMEVDDGIFDTSQKYILLLELIIDRLYLILNLSVTILESLPQLLQVFRLPKNITRSTGLSFGSLVTFFWKRLQALTNLETSEVRTEDTSTTMSVISSQTDPQPSAVCESCGSAMKMIKTLTSKIEESINEIKLKSEINKQRPIIENNIYTISQLGAMETWTNSIVADVKHIIKFSKDTFTENINMIKEIERKQLDIERSMNNVQDLQRKHEDLAAKSNEDESSMKHLITQNNELRMKNNDSDILIKKLEESNNNLQNQMEQVQTMSEQTLLDLRVKQAIEIDQINSQKNIILDLYDKSKIEFTELENKLNMEKTKQHALELQIQGSEIDKNVMETDKLKVVEENQILCETVKSMTSQLQQEQEEFNRKLQSNEEQVKELDDKLRQCKDRENILVRCPDLNGAIVYSSNAKKNPLIDMEQQLEANSIRIELLSKQNSVLQRTIEKMRALHNM